MSGIRMEILPQQVFVIMRQILAQQILEIIRQSLPVQILILLFTWASLEVWFASHIPSPATVSENLLSQHIKRNNHNIYRVERIIIR